MTAPVIVGWMAQWNVYVPAEGNVRDIEVFAFTPVMSPGGLAPLSNETLWPSAPKANVTVPPGAIVTVLGEKAVAGVAFTVAVCGEGVGVVGVVIPEPEEPHAASPRTSEAEMMVESARCII